MNDFDTSLLSARLHALADEMTPVVDPRRQVAAARARNDRQRRGRIAFLAVATATATVVVGSAVAVDVLSAGADGDSASPSVTASVTVEASPSPTPSATPTPTPTSESAPGSAAAGLPAGWEARSFLGVSLAVPSGARMADTVDDVPVSSWMDGPTFTWNGPLLGGDEYSYVSVKVTTTFEGGLAPLDGGRWFTVPGADKAYGDIEEPLVIDGVEYTDRTIASLSMLAGDRVIHVNAAFPAGPEGEQMAEDLIASLSVS
jgi:hypothetical protein